jgi:hypothetical protein
MRDAIHEDHPCNAGFSILFILAKLLVVGYQSMLYRQPRRVLRWRTFSLDAGRRPAAHKNACVNTLCLQCAVFVCLRVYIYIYTLCLRLLRMCLCACVCIYTYEDMYIQTHIVLVSTSYLFVCGPVNSCRVCVCVYIYIYIYISTYIHAYIYIYILCMYVTKIFRNVTYTYTTQPWLLS